MNPQTPAPLSERELVLTRILNASPEKLFRCWTEPALIKQWFVPKPWTIAKAEVDLRAGGSSLIVMRSPEGHEMPNPGIYLEVIPNKRLVFTDAYTKAWEPSGKPFMTAIVTFEDAGNGQAKYTATARHWSKEDREAHEKMGFHEGWGICATQLEALAKTL
ncbi:SRPBCC family protein [Oleiharenicola lentus]|uniref:SRPBCC family protein n=1 Tax=Oleiharenicola lentus TaxID=2508720 RepID=UPI003F679B3B